MSTEHTAANINDPEIENHHIVGPGQYTLVWVSLLVLTGVTVGAALLELGVFNPIVAVGIACVKAMIVILFFMHVAYSSRLVKFTCFAGFFTFLVLITMTLSDYISRAWGLW
jgi:cytochrome c oxidase subunit IV